MADHINEFLEAMRAAGVGPSNAAEIKDDDRINRYHVDGDKPRSKNGSYRLAFDGDFAFGWFLSFKDGETHNWHSRAKRGLSDEERAAHRARLDAAKARRDADVAAEHEAAAVKAAGIWNAATAATGDEAYLTRKQIQPHGTRVHKGLVVVPLRVGAEIVGLQFIAEDGGKNFLTGSNKKGAYFSIAKRDDDLSVIYICEGFATGASVREATGAPVIVAFDAGNLKPVAVAMRAKYPDARIVIAADNDAGGDTNTGIDKAQQAAVAIGGAQVIAPDEGGDWNDIHCKHGINAVAAGMAPTRTLDVLATPAADEVLEPVSDAENDPLDTIRPLGHDHGVYYFFPRNGGQVIGRSATALGRIQTLYELAPRSFWEYHYTTGDGQAKDADITKYASAQLIDECHKKGIFKSENVRGVGAWVEPSGVVMNCGARVVGRDIDVPPSEFKSKHVYESGPNVVTFGAPALTDEEAVKLRVICNKFKWRRSQFGDLLAGWLVIAPFGSALTWRPHIVVTGQKGGGKSTAINNVIKPMLGDIAIDVDGGTTEAGLRATLGVSGRPIVMDEAESENATDRMNMEKIFGLLRKASSGGKVVNANGSFTARFCACLGAINPRIEQGADKDRNTQLELVKNTSKTRETDFIELMELIRETITPEYHDRMMSRTFENIDTLLANIKTFTSEASRILGDQRSGDQVGPMVAGAYSLTSTERISREDAKAWMDAQNWDWHIAQQDVSDAEKLLMTIMTARVRYDHDGMGKESSIGDLVARAVRPDALGHDSAVQGLKGYGMRVIDGELMIANNSPQLRRVLADTPWAVWARTLGDYVGAHNYGNKPVYFVTGLTSKVTALPLSAVLGGDAVVEEVVEW